MEKETVMSENDQMRIAEKLIARTDIAKQIREEMELQVKECRLMIDVVKTFPSIGTAEHRRITVNHLRQIGQHFKKAIDNPNLLYNMARRTQKP